MNKYIPAYPIDTLFNSNQKMFTFDEQNCIMTKYYSWKVGAPVLTVDSPPDIEPNIWFSGPLTISLAPVNEGSQMYYLITTSSYTSADNADNLYTGPFTIDSTTYVYTRAYLEGWTDSGSVSNYFMITGVLQPVEFTPVPGAHPGPISVTLSCPGVYEDYIYYTLDGTDPVPGNANTFEYSSAISVNETTTIKAIAVEPNWGNSPVSTGVFEIAPVIDAVVAELLPVSQAWTQSEFTNDIRERWFSVNILESGIYFLNWADSYQGEDEDTVDVYVSFYESDRTTVVGGTNAVSSGYTTPRDVLLMPGTYFIKVYPYSSGVGSFRLRLY